MLAQELLEQPKMCNHARGLWGYSGRTPAGAELTVQSTGMGGPSAALVLADLAELGVRRAVRVGTCAALEPEPACGDLLVVLEAQAWSGGRLGLSTLAAPDLTGRVRRELGIGRNARPAIVASLDTLHEHGAAEAGAYVGTADAADMQTAALLAQGERLEMEIAAVLIVAEDADGEIADDEVVETAAKRAGLAAVAAL